MYFLAALGYAVIVMIGGGFYKWSMHVTHTWFPLVPEIPYGTACLSTFVGSLGVIVIGLLSAMVWSLLD